MQIIPGKIWFSSSARPGKLPCLLKINKKKNLEKDQKCRAIGVQFFADLQPVFPSLSCCSVGHCIKAASSHLLSGTAALLQSLNSKCIFLCICFLLSWYTNKLRKLKSSMGELRLGQGWIVTTAGTCMPCHVCALNTRTNSNKKTCKQVPERRKGSVF